MLGPRNGPRTFNRSKGATPLGLPRRSERPGKPVALLDISPLVRSARRWPADQEFGEPAVDDGRVLDVWEVSAALDPAQSRARNSARRFHAVRRRDHAVFAPVDDEDREIQRRER